MSDLTLHVHSIKDNFTIVRNDLINADLKLDTKMILIWFLSLPPGWKLSTQSIATKHKISKDTVTRISKELQEAGFLRISKYSNGKTDWHVYDVPQKPVVEPHPENQDEGKKVIHNPYPEKPDQEIQDALIRTNKLIRTKAKSLLTKYPMWINWHLEKTKEICAMLTHWRKTHLIPYITVCGPEFEQYSIELGNHHSKERWIDLFTENLERYHQYTSFE